MRTLWSEGVPDADAQSHSGQRTLSTTTTTGQATLVLDISLTFVDISGHM